MIDDIVENSLGYSIIANKRIGDVFKEAEKNHIKLDGKYKKGSEGYKLKLELDHIGRDLHFKFTECATTNGRIYQNFIDCLDRICEVVKQSSLYEKTRERKKDIIDCFISNLSLSLDLFLEA